MLKLLSNMSELVLLPGIPVEWKELKRWIHVAKKKWKEKMSWTAGQNTIFIKIH